MSARVTFAAPCRTLPEPHAVRGSRSGRSDGHRRSGSDRAPQKGKSKSAVSRRLRCPVPPPRRPSRNRPAKASRAECGELACRPPVVACLPAAAPCGFANASGALAGRELAIASVDKAVPVSAREIPFASEVRAVPHMLHRRVLVLSDRTIHSPPRR
jgi:hypothetical protein